MTVKSIWTYSTADDSKWYETHMKGDKPEDTLEVGIVMNEVPDEDETLRYSGVLTQVGKTDRPGELIERLISVKLYANRS